MIPVALTIAGSDPSGGAGIQADLKTFSALSVYGMAAVTALTVQNTTGVSEVMAVPETLLSAQISAAVTDIVPRAVKTGMLPTVKSIEATVAAIRQYGLTNVIVDPIMNSTSGQVLSVPEALDSIRRKLLPIALVVTPNLHEAAALTGRPEIMENDLEEVALQIHAMGPTTVYLKGGHLEGDAIDVFFDGSDFTTFESPRIPTSDTHGTGCVLSAAITGYLALGESLPAAIELSKEFVTRAIRNSLRLGKGRGPCDPLGIGR